MNMEAATVTLTVVGVVVSWVFKFIISGCTIVECLLPSDPPWYFLLSVAKEVRSIPWSVMIIGAGLVAVLRSTTLPPWIIWPCSTLEVPGTVDIRQREMLSIDIDPLV